MRYTYILCQMKLQLIICHSITKWTYYRSGTGRCCCVGRRCVCIHQAANLMLLETKSHWPTLCCWQFVSVFVQIFLLGAARLFHFYLFLQERRFGRSRSSMVDKFGANRKRGVDFLLVRNSNFGPILHRFWARTRFMCYLPHPYSTLILGVFPLHQITHVGRQRAHKLLSYSAVKLFLKNSNLCVHGT